MGESTQSLPPLPKLAEKPPRKEQEKRSVSLKGGGKKSTLCLSNFAASVLLVCQHVSRRFLFWRGVELAPRPVTRGDFCAHLARLTWYLLTGHANVVASTWPCPPSHPKWAAPNPLCQPGHAYSPTSIWQHSDGHTYPVTLTWMQSRHPVESVS